MFMGQFIDITGNRYGRLTVVKRTENRGNKPYWLCKCDCGNEKVVRADSLKNGAIKSCGCLLKESTASRHFKDLTGRKIGRWTVLERVGNNGEHVTWRCRCDCGTIRDVYAQSLLNGLSLSCGCYKNEVAHELNFIDLTGRRSGMLTVIKRMETDYISPSGGRSPRWLCKCDCGNEKIMFGAGIRTGVAKSCGCLDRSYGEVLIATILKEGNIRYIEQYKTDDCRDTLPLPFDFYLPDHNVFIEYDGMQHFEPIEYFGGTKHFEMQKKHDEIKEAYCKDNGHTLLRLPYYLDDDEIKEKILNILNP